MCGDDVLGEVVHRDCENWHNYGSLIAGSDLPRYRRLLDEYRRLDLAASDVESSNWTEAIGDAPWDWQREIDCLNLCLQDPSSGESWPIWEFHPTDDSGGVYWRFRDDCKK
jgi:hypothetical protein